MFRNKPASEPTVIGQGAVIEGNLRASGRVQIDGRLEGKLEVDGQLSVGPHGAIVGEVIADEIAIGGRVEGKLNARKHLYVAAKGEVHGEITYASLQVERGAVLDGRTLHGGETKQSPAENGNERARPSQIPGAFPVS